MAQRRTEASVPNELPILKGSRPSRAYENDIRNKSVAFLHRYLGGTRPGRGGKQTLSSSAATGQWPKTFRPDAS